MSASDEVAAIAEKIRKRFMPAVFSCECGGQEESCRRALDDGRTWERREVVEQIVKFLTNESSRLQRLSEISPKDEK